MKIEDLPLHLQEQVKQQLGIDEKPVELLSRHMGRTLKAEKELQALCENWLNLHGYLRLTPDNAQRKEKPKGWYGHLVVAERNPFMPDLFIFAIDPKPPLFIEFKLRDAYQPGQKEMIEAGFWTECRSFEHFLVKLVAWEKWSI